MGSQKHFEKLAETFVTYLNQQSFEPKRAQEIPAELRGPTPKSMADWFTWKIAPSASNSWTAPLEQKLPRCYPPAFNVLISRYRFCEFEVGPIMFFANTGEHIFHELADHVFADKHMSPFLLHKGYLQFGQAAGGHYDPICFTPRGLNDKKESRIVRLDHEEILIRDRIKITEEISPSIEEFMERTIGAEFEVS